MGEQGKESSRYNEMIELWMWFDLDGDGEDEYIQVILVNRQTPPVKVAEAKEVFNFTPVQPPYVRLPHGVEANEFIATGVVEPLEAYQVENNTFRNAYIDNTNLNLNMMSKRRANIPPESIMFSPNNSIQVLEMDDLEFITPPPLNIDVDRRYRMTERDIENTSGIAAWKRGIAELGTNTAFEASLIEGAANAKAELPLMITSMYALPRLAYLDLCCIDRFSSAVVEYRITDEPPTFFTSTPEQRDGISKIPFDFICTGFTRFSNKNIKVQQLLGLTREVLASPNPQVQSLVNVYEHLKQIYMLLFPQEWNMLLIKPNQMEQMNQRLLQLLQGMGGVVGGGTPEMAEANSESDVLRNTMRNVRPPVDYGGG
jgi:hypothetical protein